MHKQQPWWRPNLQSRWLLIALGSTLGGLILLGSAYLLGRGFNPTPQPPTTSAGQVSDLRVYGAMRDVQSVPKGLFTYTSTVTFASVNSRSMDNAIQQAHPEFRLRYLEPITGNPGSTTSIAMLLNSQASFAGTARPLEDEEYEKAKTRNLTLEQIPIAIDGIAFYVHKAVPISGLSIDQLQAIYLGKVTNWKQLGGPDLPIAPVSFDPKLVSMLNFVLGDRKDQDLGANVQIVRDVTTAIRKVANTPGAIGYASASEVSRQQSVYALRIAKAHTKNYVRPILDRNQINIEAFQRGTYPLTRRLFVVIRRDGTLDEQAGIAYTNLLLSDEGQRLIAEAGFVPLH
jgi:phosphate transport system substrate-binding protein